MALSSSITNMETKDFNAEMGFNMADYMAELHADMEAEAMEQAELIMEASNE